jgi:hypothetical protein
MEDYRALAKFTGLKPVFFSAPIPLTEVNGNKYSTMQLSALSIAVSFN